MPTSIFCGSGRPPACWKTSECMHTPDVSLVTSGHDVADARLHRTVAALRRAGLEVEVHGLGDPTLGPPETTVHTAARGGTARRAIRAAGLPFRARGRILITFDPDLVPAAIARRLMWGGVLVVDLHEDYVALLQDRGWAAGRLRRPTELLVRRATSLARRADLTVVADEHVPPTRARRRLVVPNLPDRSYLPPPTAPDAQPRALYVGDVRRSRGLWTMLAAAEAAPAWALDIVGPVAASERPELERWLASSPASPAVVFHGRQPPEVAWAAARGAWCGLSLLDDTPAFRSSVPTKVYEYLGAGLPVLATPLPRVVDILEEAGAGCVVRNAAEASATLRRWSSEPWRLHVQRDRTRAWAARHLEVPSPYDALAHEVCTLLEEQR
jgi:glycosyltransferase involved in cell wall biosynthesis